MFLENYIYCLEHNYFKALYSNITMLQEWFSFLVTFIFYTSRCF